MRKSHHFKGNPSRRGMATLLSGSALSWGLLAPSLASAAPFFDDATSVNFPAPACVVENTTDDPDYAAKRLGCYTNFLVISDVDGDDDLDILMANGGGYYVRDVAEESSLYLNDGTGAFSNATTALLGGVKSRLRQVAIADVDGDGRRDLYLPGGYGVDTDHLFIQSQPGIFADEADARLPPFTWSNAGAAHFGDLDNDGDLDLIVADWGAAPRNSPGDTLVYLNDGKGVFTALDDDYVPGPIDPVVGRTPIDLDLADVDGDFDLDILVNHRNGQSRIFLNDGSAKFTDGTTDNYPEKKGPYTYNVEACDYDEDGDLDLLLDNAGGTQDEPFGNISQVLNNDGTGHFSDVSAETISGEPFADDNAVKCADINGDGHYDLLVASLTNPGEKVLLNDGSAKFTYQEEGFPQVIVDDGPAGPEGNFPGDPSLGIDVADLNGDGKLDVVTGQGEFGFFGVQRGHIDRIYLGNAASIVDTTPPKFRAIETPTPIADVPTIVHFAVIDSHTSETGEHVKAVMLSYTVGTSDEETVPATFVGGDLFRAVIPAQAAGAELSFVVSATDPVGESASSEPLLLTIPALPGGEGGAAGSPAGGANEGAGAPSDAGSSGAGVGGTPATGGAPSPAGGEAAGGEQGTPPSKGDDDGCDCSVPGTAPAPYGALAGLLLGATLLFRRRRAS
jgi:MYXO-CTERM domain-containing protein